MKPLTTINHWTLSTIDQYEPLLTTIRHYSLATTHHYWPASCTNISHPQVTLMYWKAINIHPIVGDLKNPLKHPMNSPLNILWISHEITVSNAYWMMFLAEDHWHLCRDHEPTGGSGVEVVAVSNKHWEATNSVWLVGGGLMMDIIYIYTYTIYKIYMYI